MRRRGLIGIGGNQDDVDYLRFTMSGNTQSSYVKISTNMGSGVARPINLEYSYNKKNWQPYTVADKILMDKDDAPTVYLRGTNTTINNSSTATDYLCVWLGSAMRAGGNIMTLLDINGETTTVPSCCFAYFFNGETNLIESPYISATTIMDYGCYKMFSNCSGLEITQPLVATTIGASAFESMYESCTKLTSGSDIYATPNAANCFKNMFKGCSKLKVVSTYASSWNTGYTTDWLRNVYSSGTVYKLPTTTITANSTSGIPRNWTASPIS